MKYKNSLYGGIFLLIIVGITILLDVKTISDIGIIDIAYLIIPLAIIITSLVKMNTTQQIIKNGEKTKGYIIDIEYWDKYIYNYNPTGAIKVCIDGKIKRVDQIQINKKYKELYNKINTMYYIDDKINIKGIPVDVYINNEQIHVDLESVEV